MSKPYRDPLEDLHSKLTEANKGALDPELQALQAEMQSTLEQGDHHAALSQNASFRERLEAAIDRYGASHPELTRAAQSVLDVLTANGL